MRSMETVTRTFGMALRHERETAGITQRALADLLGVTPAAVSQWENDGAEPDRAAVFGIEHALGLTPGDLSRALGYLPVVDAPASVTAAIEADPELTDAERRMLLAAYRERQARRRPRSV